MKNAWLTEKNQLEHMSVGNQFGDTAGIDIALTSNNSGAAQSAWKNATVQTNSNASTYLASQAPVAPHARSSPRSRPRMRLRLSASTRSVPTRRELLGEPADRYQLRLQSLFSYMAEVIADVRQECALQPPADPYTRHHRARHNCAAGAARLYPHPGHARVGLRDPVPHQHLRLILYGVAALFGPVFIPLYMTNMFRRKFLHFVDVLLSLAMIRAVASAFIFVWGGFLNTFVLQTFQSNYSMEMWLTNLIPVLALFIAFDINMLFIPSLTQMIFGGGAGAAERLDNVISKVGAIAALAA